MINISELIADPDFTQPSGVNFVRRKVEVENHKQSVTETNHNITGIITIANEIEEEMLETADVNSEYIHVFTYEQLKTTGLEDTVTKDGYLSDIILWNNKTYKVVKVLNDTQYGFSRSTAICTLQEVS